jgi:PTH1 family peptidyl-tRNA hydrolase
MTIGNSDIPKSDLVIPQLIVGLGNPGPKYDQTRHNIGFDLVDTLARRWQISLVEHRKFQGYFGEGFYTPGHKLYLLKPTTYMNRSGQAMRAVVDWYKLPPGSVLLVYDDMDLPLGKIRLRLSGSAGGHNGMKSAIAHLGTQDFPRLRIGIGNPKDQEVLSDNTISHVLGKFSPREKRVVPEVLALAADAVEMSLRDGISKAMSLYNGRDVGQAELSAG